MGRFLRWYPGFGRGGFAGAFIGYLLSISADSENPDIRISMTTFEVRFRAKPEAARKTMQRLVTDGYLEKRGRGLYRLTARSMGILAEGRHQLFDPLLIEAGLTPREAACVFAARRSATLSKAAEWLGTSRFTVMRALKKAGPAAHRTGTQRTSNRDTAHTNRDTAHTAVVLQEKKEKTQDTHAYAHEKPDFSRNQKNAKDDEHIHAVIEESKKTLRKAAS